MTLTELDVKLMPIGFTPGLALERILDRLGRPCVRVLASHENGTRYSGSVTLICTQPDGDEERAMTESEAEQAIAGMLDRFFEAVSCRFTSA